MSQWDDIVKALKEYPTPFNHLKIGMLAQWTLETGRGSSKAFVDFLNPAGMKWRPEMEGVAEKVWYKTDSEDYRNGPNGWEKGDWFCKFNSVEKAVEGYFKFLSRAPYHGWEQNTATATDFLAFIGPTWCPGGYKAEWKEKHYGLNYHEYIIQRLYDQARDDFGDFFPGEPTGDVTWFEANRTDAGVAVVSALTGAGKAVSNLVGSPAISTKEMTKFLSHFDEAGTLLVAQTEKKPIPEAPVWPNYLKTDEPLPPPRPGWMVGKKVLLDPGHSERAQGAHGKGPNPPQEYEMNLLQARIVADRLRAAGATVIIVDPDPDNLEQVALRANGMDLYIALHHNAANANGIDEGTETHVHPLAKIEALTIAKDVNDAIVKALGTKNRGVKKTAYTVLSVSTKQTNCIRNILTESYFIDDYSDKETTATRSRKAAHAIADAVIAYFKNIGNEREMPVPAAVEVVEPFSGVREFRRGEDIWLSENFHLSEWECRCGCSPTKVNGDHVQKLQAFRGKLGKPIRVNSAYRCPVYNKKIGGASDSRHMYGDATDITADGIPPSVVYANADNTFDGVGKYATFTHVDSRGYKARWNG